MLVVAIHDVAPKTLPLVAELRERLRSWGVARATLLAVPRFHGDRSMAEDAGFVDWLRRQRDGSDEVALHGYYHQASGAAINRWHACRAAMWTAGEGEFLSAPETHVDKLRRGVDEYVATLGETPTGFVAPAWLFSTALTAQLRSFGIRWHESSTRLLRIEPREERAIASPLIGYATRSRLREQLSLTWARARMAVGWQQATVVRLAVHPNDLRSPQVMASMQRVVRITTRTRRVATTREALGL